MNHSWPTEESDPSTRELDRLPLPELLEALHRSESCVEEAIRLALPQIEPVVARAAEALGGDGRLIYIGAGTSGRLGVLDAAECPPTFGIDPDRVVGVIAGGTAALVRSVEGAEDDPEAGAHSMRDLEVSPADLVVGISASGRARFVRGALEEAGRRGAARAFVLTNPPPDDLPAEMVVAAVVGPEALTGSTRLKSGTATKRILNLLSTATMIRLGKTYRNLMVDLVPTNEKLRRRSRRILAEVTGATGEEADRLLAAAHGPSALKVALVMHLLELGPEKARRRIEESGGFLHRILG